MGHKQSQPIIARVAEARPRKVTDFDEVKDGKQQSELATSEPVLQRSVPDDDHASKETEKKLLALNSQDDFRVAFLRKLNHEKIWVPAAHRRPAKHQTVIIFDWDDTLLCTSYLRDREVLHPTVQRLLRNIAMSTKALLEMALRMGNTFIITNAMEGWVEHSAKKYIPEVMPVLQQVRIVSARTRYEGMYSHDIAKWKINAFLDVQRELDLPIVTSLSSFGDSTYEMDAANVMGEQFSQACVKTVKFQQHPSPQALQKQLHLVIEKFEFIVDSARNLKVSLEQK